MILLLNIFFRGSVEGTAHCFKNQLGLEDENMMSLELFLHAGNISVPMSVHSRIKVYDAYFDGYFGIVSEEIRRLKKYLKKENSVCIWFSKKDADEYLGMLAVIEYLSGKGKTIYLCDYTDIFELMLYHNNYTITDNDKIIKNELVNDTLPEKTILSIAEHQQYMRELNEIKAVNAELRIMKDGKIQNMPADYIDNKIFQLIGDEEVPVYKIVGTILSEDLPRMLAFTNYRLYQLLESGKLILVKQGVVQQGIYGWAKEFFKSIVKVGN